MMRNDNNANRRGTLCTRNSPELADGLSAIDAISTPRRKRKHAEFVDSPQPRSARDEPCGRVGSVAKSGNTTYT